MEFREIKELEGQVLDRKGKLLRWAKIVRESKLWLQLGHNLEMASIQTLKATNAHDAFGGCHPSAMSVATEDPVFNAAGLGRDASIFDLMGFFEISKADLHEFSCDCGGELTGHSQAGRIEGLAG